MTFFHLALQAESAGELASALTGYEQSIAVTEGHLDAFTNLAFLYWDISYDYGVQTHFLRAAHLPEVAVMDFDARWQRVLAQAIEQHPNEPESYYWRGYFTHESTYADQADAFLLAMPERWPQFDLAYLYRYQHGLRSPTDQAALQRLHEEYSSIPTRKAVFVTNTIETIWRFDL